MDTDNPFPAHGIISRGVHSTWRAFHVACVIFPSTGNNLRKYPRQYKMVPEPKHDNRKQTRESEKDRKYRRGSWGCPGLHDTRCQRRLRPRWPALLAHWLSIAMTSGLLSSSLLRAGGTAGTGLRADEKISLRVSFGRGKERKRPLIDTPQAGDSQFNATHPLAAIFWGLLIFSERDFGGRCTNLWDDGHASYAEWLDMFSLFDASCRLPRP